MLVLSHRAHSWYHYSATSGLTLQSASANLTIFSALPLINFHSPSPWTTSLVHWKCLSYLLRSPQISRNLWESSAFAGIQTSTLKSWLHNIYLGMNQPESPNQYLNGEGRNQNLLCPKNILLWFSVLPFRWSWLFWTLKPLRTPFFMFWLSQFPSIPLDSSMMEFLSITASLSFLSSPSKSWFFRYLGVFVQRSISKQTFWSRTSEVQTYREDYHVKSVDKALLWLGLRELEAMFLYTSKELS